jgi:hypothetical protein
VKKDKRYLSEGGAKALMVICSILMLFMLYVHMWAAASGGFASVAIILLQRMMGPTYRNQPGFGLVAGLPCVVGFLLHPGVFCFSFFLMWAFMVGFADSGALHRAMIKAKAQN